MRIIIDATTTPNQWRLPEGPVSGELYADVPFEGASGNTILAGNYKNRDFYVPVSASVSGGILSLGAINCESTEDSPTNQLATYTMVIRPPKGRPIIFLANFRIPTLGTGQLSFSWATLMIHKNGITPRQTTDTFSKQQILDLIANAPNAALANIATYGRARFRTAPADSSDPIAVEDNDPRVAANQAATVASIRALGTGALQAAAGNDLRLSESVFADSPVYGITLGSGQTQAVRIANRVGLQTAAAAAITAGKRLMLPAGIVEIEFQSTSAATAKVAVTGDLVVEGAGREESVIKYFPTASGFVYYGFFVTAGKNLSLRHLTLQGPAAGSGFGTRAIWYDGGPYATGVTGSVRLYDVKINGQFYEAIAKSSTGAGGTDDWTTDFILDIDSCDIAAYFQEIAFFTGGGRAVTDGAVTSGLAVLTSATASFSSADVGASVSVTGAGVNGANLQSYISAFTNSTTVTLADSALTTVSGANATIGAAVNTRLHIRNSYIHDQVLGSAGGYFVYVHPSVSLDIQHSRFFQSRTLTTMNYGIHIYSGAGIPVNVSPQYQGCVSNYFGGNLNTGILTGANYRIVIATNTFATTGIGVLLQIGSADMFDNEFLGGGVVDTLSHGITNTVDVNITGGRVAMSIDDRTGILASWVGSTWNIRDVDFTSGGVSNNVILNTTDVLTLNVDTCRFSGKAARAIYSRKGATNVYNCKIFGDYSSGAGIDIYGTPSEVNVNNSTFNLSGGVPIGVQAVSASGALRGQSNVFTGAEPTSATVNAIGYLQMRSALSPNTIVSAATAVLSFNYDTYHVSGAITIDNIIVVNAATQRTCGGKAYLIFDSTAATSTSGNIKPKSTGARTANTMASFQYDPVTSFWYEQ